MRMSPKEMRQRQQVMRSYQVEHVEFFGGPLDGHIQEVSLPADALNDVAAIPVDHRIIETLSGQRTQLMTPATSIAVYVRQDDGPIPQYYFLQSATPGQFNLAVNERLTSD